MPFASSQGEVMTSHVSQKPTGTINDDLALITGTEEVKPTTTNKATTTEEIEATEVPEVYTLANALLALLAIALAGAAFWWLGGSRLVMRLLGNKGKGRYSRVGDDEEKRIA
ncbi:hypothetical protein BDN72DRAFT_834223 [Pluteus cervinus]|uniref:Uncharacterized protein n=1 Tax=Pluteus cervinus TaxID=181527 RepID=A0ACD3B7S5_9AGAR|nr:hypothetical protein BDN72DRAFT_834223 [Pluteus cervinus]